MTSEIKDFKIGKQLELALPMVDQRPDTRLAVMALVGDSIKSVIGLSMMMNCRIKFCASAFQVFTLKYWAIFFFLQEALQIEH